MINFPKLRYPINARKDLSNEDSMILLAYDMLWRMRPLLLKTEASQENDYLQDDIDANLSNLGHHIETVICDGDLALRFEGFDKETPVGVDVFPLHGPSSDEMKTDFKQQTEEKLNEQKV